MEDREVLEGFVNEGATRGFGKKLHIEGDTLFLSGWWHASLRVAPEVFAVRNEEPREEAPVLGELLAVLAGRGLSEVMVDHPLIQPLTYTELSLGQVSWALWAPDLATGEEALSVRVTADSFLSESPYFAPDEPEQPQSADFTAELGGARRVAGLPASLVLALGLDPAQVKELEESLDDCRVEAKAIADFPASACGALIPGAIVVDARAAAGREYIMELRTEACGRYIPVMALTEDGSVPLGADEALPADLPAGAWVAPLRALLP